MYATNLNEFGRLLETDNYRTKMLHNDLWEIFDNKKVRSFSYYYFVNCTIVKGTAGTCCGIFLFFFFRIGRKSTFMRTTRRTSILVFNLHR